MAVASNSPEMGRLIRRRLDSGELSLPGFGRERPVAAVRLIGQGESYAVWRLDGSEAGPLVLRVARRPPEVMPRPLADEFAALALVPVDVGPQPVALDPAPDNPLGHPWLAATWVPGNSKPPAAWTEADLQVWAQVLARLHDPVYQRRGPVRQPTIEGLSLVSEFEQILAWWRDNQPAVATTPAAAALGERVLNWLGDYEADFRRLDRFSFIHADLVAGNVVFDGPRCWLVDWEWAEIGDVARDLALLGGWGAAGPSYVPLNDAQINLLLETYANAVLVKSGSRPDLESLRRRRDAWEMCNRYPTCLHYQLQARRSDPTGVYAEAAAQLWDSIATRLATA